MYTIDQKLKELHRELEMRKKLYPSWSKGPGKKMTPQEAETRIAILREIIADYEKQKTQNEGVSLSLDF